MRISRIYIYVDQYVILGMKQLSHDNTVNKLSIATPSAISETITDWQSYNERKHCHTVRYDAHINTVKTYN